jgi:hypothetical protein
MCETNATLHQSPGSGSFVATLDKANRRNLLPIDLFRQIFTAIRRINCNGDATLDQYTALDVLVQF